MLLAVDYKARFLKTGKSNTRGRHFAGHGFMSEIETKAVSCRSAHDAGKQDRSAEKIEIVRFLALAKIPQDRCTCPQLYVVTPCEQAEGRRSACHDAWDGKP